MAYKKDSSIKIKGKRKNRLICREWHRNEHKSINPFAYIWRIRLTKECDSLARKLNKWMDRYPRQRLGKTWDKWENMFTHNIYPGITRKNFSRDRVNYKGMVSLKNIKEIINSIKNTKKNKSMKSTPLNYNDCYEETDKTKPPFACVHCLSKDISKIKHQYHNEHREYIEFWHCVSCGKEWRELYEFKNAIQ
jgi:DNA-directed RNA polymerase subunit M/transcription elongation factor TFIIS